MSMPAPSAIVTITDNGYVVETLDGVTVCEDDDTDLGQCQATARMLYTVLEAVGSVGSKHDAYRVRVSVIARDTGEDVLA